MMKKLIIFFIISICFSNITLAQDPQKDRFSSIIFSYTPISFSDFDDNIDSLNNLFTQIYNLFPDQDRGNLFEKSRFSYSFETELRIWVTKGIDIGVIFTYLHARKKSAASALSNTNSTAGQVSFKLNVINPNLVLFYYVPISKGFLVELYGGLGYHYAWIPFWEVLNLNLVDYSFGGQQPYVYTSTVNTKLKSHGWGLLGGITFEVRPVRALGFLLGVRYKSVEMGRIFGSGTFKDSNTPERQIDEGILYYGEKTEWGAAFPGEDFPVLVFSDVEPLDYRQAILDLTGFSLIIGVRLYF